MRTNQTLTDEELIDIWENQRDYQQEYVFSVWEQLKRRRIDVDKLRVFDKTTRELEEERKDTKKIIIAVRFVSVAFFFAALLYMGKFVQLFEQPKGIGDLLAPIINIGLIAALFYVSVHLWLKKRWACAAGLILVVLNALCFSYALFNDTPNPDYLIVIIAYGLITIFILILYSGFDSLPIEDKTISKEKNDTKENTTIS